MKFKEEIFETEIFQSEPFIEITDVIPSSMANDELKLIASKRLNNGGLYMTERVFSEIKKGMQFEVIFDCSEINKKDIQKIEVLDINLRSNPKAESIFAGMSGVVLLEFENQVSEILDRVRTLDAPIESSKKYRVFVSSLKFYERLKDLLNG